MRRVTRAAAAAVAAALAAAPIAWPQHASAEAVRSIARVLHGPAGVSARVGYVEIGVRSASPPAPASPTRTADAPPPFSTAGAGQPIVGSDGFAVPGAAARLDPQPCLRRKFGGRIGTAAFCFPGATPSAAPRGATPPAPSLAVVARIAADRAIALAPDPALRVAPRRMGLTGLRSFFWTARPPPITASAAVGSTLVTAQARPVRFVWSYGDGATQDTPHPGRPWPRAGPGALAHVFEATGTYELALEVVWEARWRAGRGPWRHLGYFATSASRRYPVRQVLPLLVPPR